MATSGDDSKKQTSTAKRLPPNAGKGQNKGSPNKVTKTLKEALLASFETLGGEAWLVQLAESDPKAYASLLGRLVPSEISAEVVSTTFPELPDGAVFTPKSFPNREAWDAFFDWAKREPGAVVIRGGLCRTEDVFPIVRVVNRGWVCGGIPSTLELASYDLEFAPPPEPLPPA